MALIGTPLRRLEDEKLLRGQGRFLDDLAYPGTLHLALLRSPVASARILGLRRAEALALPGVVAVYTGEEVPLKVPVRAPQGAKAAFHPALAQGVVRYVGEPIAAVLAETRAQAEDALQALAEGLELEPLPQVASLEEALEDRVLVHPELGTNLAHRRYLRAGEVEEAFRRAHRVVRARIRIPRLAPTPLEGRGVLAVPEGGGLLVYTSTQVPHRVRDLLAEALGLPQEAVRVVAPDVGGGFGAKLNLYPEEVLAAHLALRTGRPVKWVEGRREAFLATTHGRGQVGEVALALSEEGEVLGLRARILADAGAYLLDTTLPPHGGTVLMLQGPYALPALEVELLALYTHATPTGAYRGAGRPEATFYLERIFEIAAKDLGEDPARFRRRHLLRGPFPYRTLTGAVYDSGDYPKALEALLEAARYEELRRFQEEARRTGRLVGLGLALYVEVTGFGYEVGVVRVHPDGSATLFTGTSPHGQGAATAFAQIAADTLGIPPGRIRVVHGDTQAVPLGQGTGGSRTLQVGGSAILLAAERVREKMRRIAAHLLEAAPEDLELSEGAFRVRGTPLALPVAEVARAAHDPRRLPPGLEPGLEEKATFSLQGASYPFGAHLALVEVDPDTYAVRLLGYWAVDDVGRVVNPLLVEGQVQGGVVQGLGQALLEEVALDPYGQNLTASLLEYALPRAQQAPKVAALRTETPSPTNPLGAKGIGEAGAIAAPPAIANAVLDALGLVHLDIPLTPERLFRAVRGRADAGPE